MVLVDNQECQSQVESRVLNPAFGLHETAQDLSLFKS